MLVSYQKFLSLPKGDVAYMQPNGQLASIRNTDPSTIDCSRVLVSEGSPDSNYVILLDAHRRFREPPLSQVANRSAALIDLVGHTFEELSEFRGFVRRRPWKVGEADLSDSPYVRQLALDEFADVMLMMNALAYYAGFSSADVQMAVMAKAERNLQRADHLHKAELKPEPAAEAAAMSVETGIILRQIHWHRKALSPALAVTILQSSGFDISLPDCRALFKELVDSGVAKYSTFLGSSEYIQRLTTSLSQQPSHNLSTEILLKRLANGKSLGADLAASILQSSGSWQESGFTVSAADCRALFKELVDEGLAKYSGLTTEYIQLT